MRHADKAVIQDIVRPDPADAGCHPLFQVTVQTRLRAIGFFMIDDRLFRTGREALYSFRNLKTFDGLDQFFNGRLQFRGDAGADRRPERLQPVLL